MYFFVMRYVVAREGLEAVGLWSLTIGMVAMIRLLDLAGTNSLSRVVAAEVQDDLEKVRSIDTFTLAITACYLLIISALLPLFVSYIESTVPEELSYTAQWLMVLAGVSLVLNVMGAAQLAGLIGIERSDLRALVLILGNIIFGFLAITLLQSFGIIGVAYAQIGQNTFILVSGRMLLKEELQFMPIVPSFFSKAAAKKCFRYGIRMQLTNIPMAMLDPMLRIILARWTTLEFLGLYDLCYKLAGNTRALIQSRLVPLIPELTKLQIIDREKANALHRNETATTYYYLFGAYSALILLSPMLSWFLLSEFSISFVFHLTVLSIGWFVASTALTTELFAKASDYMLWPIVGQWLILLFGLVLVPFLLSLGQSDLVSVSVATSICLGHLVSYIGSTSSLGLGIEVSLPNRFAQVSFLLFLAASIVCVIVLKEHVI